MLSLVVIRQGFKGIGKVKPIKVLEQNDRFEAPLSEIGCSFNLSEDLEEQLHEFVCCLYSRKHHKDTNELRARKMWWKQV